MKTTLKTKLLGLLLLPIVLCLIASILISTIKLRNYGEAALINKSEAILSRMESVRSFVAGQNRLEGEIQHLKETYPDGMGFDYSRCGHHSWQLHHTQSYTAIRGEPEIIVDITRQIANGNLNINFQKYGSIEGVFGAVWEMTEKLRSILVSVIKSADNTANIGHQINASSKQLSEGANVQ